uniref:Uncharacterized protein n=1 Tax=Nothobranchius furzeri TaxID=105023 RepID=A0A8C6P555_NOTFU
VYCSVLVVRRFIVFDRSRYDLADVKMRVLQHRYTTIPLITPHGATLIIGPLEDTPYDTAEFNGCTKFYAPIPLNLQTIGHVDNVPFTSEGCALMACDSGYVYGYDGDELHLVAYSLDQLFTEGMKHPGFETYYYGEAFITMNETEWITVRESSLGKELDRQHADLIAMYTPRVQRIMARKRGKQTRVKSSVTPTPSVE